MSTPGSGPYEITDCDGHRIGRAMNETHDLAPKAVHAGTDDPHPIWDVKRLDNKLYILGNRGAPTANINGWLYALLENLDEKTEWELVNVTEGVFQ
ncbi:hypothetical protein P691DRAFT_284150 [Macrolepiota fuliginosa MF-IS2]|uniref:Uncharacterized protein n=1 Tax=Macrolepiota fuliginosa MF-IS2 TaxID=1400762 RepID=A0A9P5X639_9AGAR|nr:hypothetical protein P691DRAFT_284150 [Macrolepiota fuliginosa MF-IS2]